jgi:hypothetical protein
LLRDKALWKSGVELKAKAALTEFDLECIGALAPPRLVRHQLDKQPFPHFVCVQGIEQVYWSYDAHAATGLAQ